VVTNQRDTIGIDFVHYFGDGSGSVFIHSF
jgi:hypothetical protein